jgi:hypothetical protein
MIHEKTNPQGLGALRVGFFWCFFADLSNLGEVWFF